MNKFPITKNGYIKLEEELRILKTQDRINIIEAIAEARAHGDLSENAEYHSAKEKQGFIEAKIKDLEDKFSRSDVIDVTKLTGGVKFGATVVVYDEEVDANKTYRLVSDYEADLEKNLLSIASPIAKAIIGKNVGDTIEVKTPKGNKILEILSIEYKEFEI
jgi:transcription elongation factor GreA